MVALVATLTGTIIACLFARVTEGGTEQVGGATGLAMTVVTAQLKLTWPIKPPEGMIVTDDELPFVAPGPMFRFPLLKMANEATGAAATVIVKGELARTSEELQSNTLRVA